MAMSAPGSSTRLAASADRTIGRREATGPLTGGAAVVVPPRMLTRLHCLTSLFKLIEAQAPVRQQLLRAVEASLQLAHLTFEASHVVLTRKHAGLRVLVT